MVDAILLSVAMAGAIVLLAGIVRSMAFRERKHCPGPRRRWYGMFWPLNWFVRIGCGYDMTGHLRAEVAWPLHCPECGHEIRRLRHLERRPRRWRFMRSGGVIAASAILLFTQRFFAQTHWDDDLPTWALIEIERWCGDSTPIGVVKEVRQRFGRMTPEQRTRALPLFVHDLRADDINRNGRNASWILSGHDSPEIRQALREALHSEDWQQRQTAAMILCDKGESPGPDLQDVLAEALRYDWRPGPSRLDASNATSALEYLRKRPLSARPFFLNAFSSADDWQQRQIAARMLCELNEAPTPELLHTLIVEFSQPGVRYDGEVHDLLYGRGMLAMRDYLGGHRGEAEPVLRASLHAASPRVRSFAACLLRDLNDDLDDDVMRGLIDGLRWGTWTREWMAARFFIDETINRLVETGPAAAEVLKEGTRSDDAQQRFLSAATAGFAGLEEIAAEAVPVLVEHVRDNDLRNDAFYATRALLGFGESARPWIEPATESDDEQLRTVAVYLVDRMEGRHSVLGPRMTDWGDEPLLNGRTNDPARLNWYDLGVPRIDPARISSP